jgi:MFS family permease
MRISIEQVNLTVTVYLIAPAIFPAVIGNIANRYGRRIAFIFCMGAYLFVNIGLALQRNLAALFALRILQSTSISGAYNIHHLERAFL